MRSEKRSLGDPVCRVTFFHEDNFRLRYVSREEYDRLIQQSCVRWQHARSLTPECRRAARPAVDEDDHALCAPVARVPVSGSEPARSLAGAEPEEGQENWKGKKRAKRLERQQVGIESASFCSRNWLAALDDFRNWLIREAAQVASHRQVPVSKQALDARGESQTDLFDTFDPERTRACGPYMSSIFRKHVLRRSPRAAMGVVVSAPKTHDQ